MYARKHKYTGNPQTIQEHLHNVAQMCGNQAAILGLSKLGYVLGLVHDIGKARSEWQAYLDDNSLNELHSIFSANIFDKIDFPMVAYWKSVCAGHHTSLKEVTKEKVAKYPLENNEIVETILQEVAFYLDSSEWTEFLLNIRKFQSFSGDSCEVTKLLTTQFLYSCLVDADRLDARNFDGTPSREFIGMEEIYQRYLRYMHAIRSSSKASDSVKTVRNHVFSDCDNAVELDRNFFSLNAPTGSGKTMAAFNFAIKRALKTKKKRIIYVLPYQSIVKQTFGDLINFLGKENVLEYHAAEDNYVRDTPWEEPVVVTTHHQFFESFFSCNASRSRKLRYIAESVVVFDEVQLFPSQFFPLLEILFEFSCRELQCDILAMSATLPRWSKSFLPHEIATNINHIHELSKRVKINTVSWNDAELLENFMSKTQTLYVVNSRRRAREFWELCNDESVYCLTTLVHQKRREEIIEEIKNKLKDGKTCRIVATTLIDVGVDIDVQVVFRDFSDLGAMLQSFGRCNRHGARPLEDVYILEPQGLPRNSIEDSITKRFVNENKRKNTSLDSVETVQRYYTDLLRNTKTASIGLIDKISTYFNDRAFGEIAKLCRLISDDGEEVTLFAAGEEEKYAEFQSQAAQNRLNYRELQRYVVRVPKSFIQGLDFCPNSGITDSEDDGKQILPPMIPREHYDQYGLLL